MCKTKGFGIVALLLALVLILSSMSFACGAKPAAVAPPSPQLPAQTPPEPPSVSPEPPSVSPPISTEPEIPANYTTYTDESKLFSISYPKDWEMDPSRTADIDKNIKEVVNSLKSGVPIEGASRIFFVGRRTAKGYEPSVSIAVESLPEGISLDEIVDGEVRGAKSAIPDYQVLSMVKTTIDGREATIIDTDGTVPGGGKLHFLSMITLVDKTTWVVGCSATIDDFAQWENDFNTIVRSLRISNNVH